jgi:UDP-N-acetylmuramate dehydrogenase
MLVATNTIYRQYRAMPKTFKEKVRSIWQGDIQWDCPMHKYSTLRVGGPALAVVFPKNRGELTLLITGLNTFDIKWRVIGRGSNILVPDDGFAGVVIVVGNEFGAISIMRKSENYAAVAVEAGCSLPRFVSWCTKKGFSGCEFACGIPGSVGGAIIMNAGAWGGEIADIITSVTFLDRKGQLVVVERDALKFGYRMLTKAPNSVVISASFALTKADKEDISEKCKQFTKLRKEKQPQGEPSAGSFFKNPVGVPAGKLIEEAGFKGFQLGGAKVSEKHANFIVNTGDAKAADIFMLMKTIQNKVYEQSGIMLEPEVHILQED